MKKSFFTVFLLVWCVCIAAGQNDELFRRALSERNERRWQEISDRFIRQDEETWSKGYSDWVWKQISDKISAPDIFHFNGEISEWESESDALFQRETSDLPADIKNQVAARFADYKKRIKRELDVILMAKERRSELAMASASAGKKNIQPFLDEMNAVIAELKEKNPASEAWFAEAESFISQGRMGISEESEAYFAGLEAAIEQTSAAFAEESQAFRDTLESIFSQFSTAVEIKEQALTAQKFFQGEKRDGYEEEAAFWAETVRQCEAKEKELGESDRTGERDSGGDR